MTIFRVLIVEDEALAAEAHAHYTARVEGFEVAGIARSGAEAARLLADDPSIDLILLDMHLPDGHGLNLLKNLRGSGHPFDVIAVTSARDADVVRQAVSQGVVLYLLKPFTFATFRDRLQHYAAYRERLASASSEVAQDEVDLLYGSLRPTAAALPKGMSIETMRHIKGVVRAAQQPMSASEVAAVVGTSRVTARRYLEHLAESQAVERQPRYGASGRPEVEYRSTS